MSTLLYYVVCWKINNQKLFLLWCDGDKKADHYVLCKKSKKLLITLTNEEIVVYAEKHKMDLSDHPAHIVDFNKLNTALRKR